MGKGSMRKISAIQSDPIQLIKEAVVMLEEKKNGKVRR